MKTIKNGKGRLYTLEKDRVKYKVYTEINSRNNKEEFCDFYTNRRVQGANSYISERDAQNGNTQLSARITSPRTAAKVAETSENASIAEEKYREGDGAHTDDELSYENAPIAKVTGKQRETTQSMAQTGKINALAPFGQAIRTLPIHSLGKPFES